MKVSNAISSRTESPNAQPGKRESCSSTERFTLSGPSADFDPRFNAYRGDLADVDLASKLFAPHYAKSSPRRCGAHAADLHSGPSETSEIVGTLEPGQGFDLLDITAGWAWGYRSEDRRVAYLAATALAEPD